jgi:hypothetical protein
LAGALDVDLARELRHIGEDDHAVVRDLDETLVHREGEVAPVGQHEPQRRRRERTEERCVTAQERDLSAVFGTGDDHLGVSGVEHLLR